MIQREKMVLGDLELMVMLDMIIKEDMNYIFEPKETQKILIAKFWESRLDDRP